VDRDTGAAGMAGEGLVRRVGEDLVNEVDK
jgi:hypothetical protein